MRGLKLVLVTSSTVAFVLILAGASAWPARADWPPAPPLTMPADEQVGLLPPSVTVERADKWMWKVTFEYKPEDTPERVNIAGTFNRWNPRNKPMEKVEGQNAWRITLLLGPGTHLYKFVRNGSQWVPDPLNPDKTDDGHGGYNSLLHLGKLASLKKSNAKRGDGDIAVVGLEHTQMPSYFQPLGGGRVLVRYRTLAHDVQHVSLAVLEGPTVPMYVELAGPLFEIWEAAVQLPDSAYAPRSKDLRQFTYTFVLEDGQTRASHPTDFTATFKETDVFHTPDWAKQAIWYQIMPDRFRNGNKDNDPPNVHPWTSDWFKPAGDEGKDGQTFYKWYVFSRLYGGDLDGIEQELPYLKALGVNAIYLNPIFQANSSHKYNATNYLHVDEAFGGGHDYAETAASEDLTDPSTWKWTTADKRFLAFLKAAHAQGFRVIIDGVFNHVGTAHPAFQDVEKNGKKSKYADWFDITSWKPFKYKGWAGFDALPVFRKDESGIASAGAKKHIFDVTRRWMDPDGDGDPSDGIDGWRLDVPGEIPPPFWAEWRQVVKGVNPDAYITGEIWHAAPEWLDGKHFDAVMNYPFARAAIGWVIDRKNKLPPSEIDYRLAKLRLDYPAEATYVLQNLVDSHDTDRIASMALNPDRDYDHQDRVQDDNPEYDNDKPGPAEYARVRLIALLQMTYVGAPMIYYGDEVGMWGADDPTCRKPMIWKDLEPYDNPDATVMDDHLAWYKKAIALRNAHPALRTGVFRTLLTDDTDDVWCFSRYDKQEQMIVALNASAKDVHVKINMPAGAPSKWRVLFSGGGAPIRYSGEELTFNVVDGQLPVPVPAVGGTVLIATP